MQNQFEPIASRVIDILGDDGLPTGQVLVQIGRPWQEPTGEWAAPYRISNVGNGRIYRAFGLDAIHALQLVQVVIGGTLAGLAEAREDRLRWVGESDLGFPLPPEPPSPSQR